MFSIRQFRQLNVNHIYNIFSRKSDSTITNAQWESALVVCSQIFGHSSNYFTIWKITKMLMSQPNLNGFLFCNTVVRKSSLYSVV